MLKQIVNTFYDINYYYLYYMYIQAMCARLCVCLWSPVPHGLTSMALVNCGISGGIHYLNVPLGAGTKHIPQG